MSLHSKYWPWFTIILFHKSLRLCKSFVFSLISHEPLRHAPSDLRFVVYFRFLNRSKCTSGGYVHVEETKIHYQIFHSWKLQTFLNRKECILHHFLTAYGSCLTLYNGLHVTISHVIEWKGKGNSIVQFTSSSPVVYLCSITMHFLTCYCLLFPLNWWMTFLT